jgi:hypothetical protein
MTTAVATALAESLQSLIDARLDTIDRMLTGRMPRSDRVAIVREVESQIEELLAERDPATLAREDILEVLGRLDPPEAYLPDDASEVRMRVPAARLVRTVETSTARRGAGTGTGRLGGILGATALAVVLVLYPLVFALADLLSSLPLLIVGAVIVALLGLAGGLSGIILGIQGRRQGTWPILGIVLGAFAMLSAIVGGIALLFLA